MRKRWTAILLSSAITASAFFSVANPSASAVPPPLDLTRPRVVAAGVDLAVVRSRLDREPYRTIFRQLHDRAHQADGVALDDHTIGSERTKAKSTKDLAFEYALDRTIVNGTIAPFASPAERTAVGDLARDHLLAMYTISRLTVPAPLGGSDRDINTSEELLQYASAYDTLVAAGYDFGADGPTVRSNITDLAAALYRNYVDPPSASGATLVLPNNHRAKSAASLGVAALALFDTPPAEGAPSADVRDPSNWLAFALDQVDLIQRWTYVSPGGGYGEGPYYQRYASQNLLPFTRAWDHARGNRAWNIGPRSIPDLWQHPAYRATQRWMLDLTLPDGGLAPIDDGNVGFSHYFGLAPVDPADAPAFLWRWAHAPTPYDTDGSVDLAADALANFDDSIAPAPPTGSPTRLDDESGTAVFRSDWNPDAVEVVAVGEHGAAMELGRDRDGLGQIASAAHEQPDTGSYLMHAFGERLLLDPGYLTYEQRGLVGKAPDHNLVLVNGAGPGDPFIASILWTNGRDGLPGVDGQATLSGLADTPAWDRAQLDTAYAGAKLRRRFEFVDDRYLVTFDSVTANPGDAITWVTHGNGGGTSGGAFTPGAVGGRWEHGAARVDTGLATSAGATSLSTRTTNHEGANRELLTHTALDTTAVATNAVTRSVSIAYPTHIGDAAPAIITLPDTGDGRVRIRVTDVAGDRVVTATQFADGKIAIRDRHLDGTTRVVDRDRVRKVTTPAGFRATRTRSGRLGIRFGTGAVDVVAPQTDIALHGLPFVPRQADGACNLTTNETGTFVRTSRDGAVTLRPTAANSAPGADPGPDVENAPPSSFLHLDARASCDANHDALTAHWQLITAPAGSAWILAFPDTMQPWLVLDVPGPYRVRLTVTDSHGAISRSSDLTVFAGPRCVGDRLAWSDPRC
jgi:Heparinase II/III-like protein.